MLSSIAKNSKQLGKIADEFVAEFLKCKSSFNYFCRKYVLIELPGKDQLLKPYRKQVELIDTVENINMYWS